MPHNDGVPVGSFGGFWKAAKIYYEHPNAINKQIVISEHLFGCQLSAFTGSKDSLTVLLDDVSHYLRHEDNRLKSEKPAKSEFGVIESVDTAFSNSEGCHLLVRRLLPKRNNGQYNYYELFIVDKENTKLTIITIFQESLSKNESAILGYKDPYSIVKYKCLELEINNDKLKLQHNNDLGEKGCHWLKTIFMPKFENLMLDTNNETKKNVQKLPFTCVVDVVQFYKLYEEIKSKYAHSLMKEWTESTDPKKFIYEDIGIATYLLLLWNKGNKDKQRFVDLGCGNGLLVHILNSEGHLGIGLDMRKRNIWDTYNSNTILKEEVIVPTENPIYPEADWLIGNHSDELTPWLPIIARNSNHHCQYFVLPCCPYQLNGQKFQRQNSKLSSYQDFMNYVKKISDLCDFETFIDKLRIPSTKRICLIGFRKSKSLNDNAVIAQNILDLISFNCQSVMPTFSENKQQTNSENISNATSLTFKVRESTEKVRNCTKLQKNVITEVLNIVTNTLLETECNVPIIRNSTSCTWNRGGKLMISDLAGRIHNNLLKEMKNECKGLQTLLKNHHFVFNVNNGEVQFRSPEDLQNLCDNFLKKNDKTKWKNRSCWFDKNHPDGCPLSDNKCSYIHS